MGLRISPAFNSSGSMARPDGHSLVRDKASGQGAGCPQSRQPCLSLKPFCNERC